MRHVILYLFLALTILMFNCSKDSSCESCTDDKQTNDTLYTPPPPIDSLPKPTKFTDGEWSFVEGNHFYTGKIDTGYIRRDQDGESISFWGPTITSNEVVDTVFSNTIWFDKPFTSTIKNIVAIGSTFYFQEQKNGIGKWLYEHKDFKGPLHTLDSYDANLKEYKGRFSGYVVNKLTLDTCYIQEGKYRVRF